MPSFYAEKPEEIQFTLTMTLSLKEWRDIAKQLDDTYESNRFTSEVSSMSIQANKMFWPKKEELNNDE